MIATRASLYLPISARRLCAFLNESREPPECATLSVAELASLTFLHYLPKLSTSPETFLAEVIKELNTAQKTQGTKALLSEVLASLTCANIRRGRDLLPKRRIALMDEAIVSRCGYLDVEGNWDYGFVERHEAQLTAAQVKIQTSGDGTRLLTEEQSRIYREFNAQVDDHLHVQGYAGTGKSSLIRSLLAMLEGISAQVLVLTLRYIQSKGLLLGTKTSGRVYIKTFAGIAREILAEDLRGSYRQPIRRANRSRAVLSDETLSSNLGIHSKGDLPASRIARAVRGTLFRYCHSGDVDIGHHHLPASYAGALDEESRAIVLHHTAEFWQAMLTPAGDKFGPFIRGYHQIKWAALNGLQVPSKYSHVLIDESHDLSKSMLQILDCSPQAIISLGDEYQSIEGLSQQGSHAVRRRVATHSIRSGRHIESIVNPIIEVHPARTKEKFFGNQFHDVEITYYERTDVPSETAAIVAFDSWGLFEWTQRIVQKGYGLELLSGFGNLNGFVQDCIELFHRGTRPRRGELFRFASWDAVAEKHHETSGFRRIDHMLRDGYGRSHWEATSKRFRQNPRVTHSLGLIGDVKNLEFDTVMLSKEFISRVWSEDITARAQFGSAIYVAVTRAKHRLIVPESLRAWIEEISAKSTSVEWHKSTF